MYDIYRLFREENTYKCVYTELVKQGKVFCHKTWKQQSTLNATIYHKTSLNYSNFQIPQHLQQNLKAFSIEYYMVL